MRFEILLLLPLLLTVVVLLPITTTAAYGQQSVIGGIFGGVSENTKNELLEVARERIQNMNITHFTLYDDGRLYITDRGESITDYGDDTTIQTTHNWTAENGYTFSPEDNQIIKPDGSPLFTSSSSSAPKITYVQTPPLSPEQKQEVLM